MTAVSPVGTCWAEGSGNVGLVLGAAGTMVEVGPC